MRPEEMALRQWFGIRHVDDGAGEMTAIERGKQSFMIELGSSSGVDERGADGKDREEFSVEKSACLPRQRQQADEDVRLRCQRLQASVAMMARRSLDFSRATAPSGERKTERPQPFQNGLSQQAEAEDADPPVRRLHLGNGAPGPGALLSKIGRKVTMQSENGERDIFLHHPHDAFLDHPQDLHMRRDSFEV